MENPVRLLHPCRTPGCDGFLSQIWAAQSNPPNSGEQKVDTLIHTYCAECVPDPALRHRRLCANDRLNYWFDTLQRDMDGRPYPSPDLPQVIASMAASLEGPVPTSFEELLDRLRQPDGFEEILKKAGIDLARLPSDPEFIIEHVLIHLLCHGLVPYREPDIHSVVESWMSS